MGRGTRLWSLRIAGQEWHLRCRGCDEVGGREGYGLEDCSSTLLSRILIVLSRQIGEAGRLSGFCKRVL